MITPQNMKHEIPKPQKNKYTWWEKTVEYNFIAWSKLQFNAIPLDGDLEQAGDTLFENECNKFFLIEFKRQKDDNHIEKELNKFTDSQDALIKIQSNDSNKCHFVVYGSIFRHRVNNEKKFGLQFEHYIEFVSDSDVTLGNSFKDQYSIFKEYALDLKKFFDYLSFFCSLKKGKNLYGTSESPFANTLVATKDGTVIPLDELIGTSPKLQHAINVSPPDIEQEQKRIHTISGPCM